MFSGNFSSSQFEKRQISLLATAFNEFTLYTDGLIVGESLKTLEEKI